MDLKIMALEKGIENALRESALPAEVKRLMLVELTYKMEAESKMAVNIQLAEGRKEGEKTDAESI